MKLEKRAVKRVAARFQYDIREASGSAAELGIRRAGLHLELLNRIHRRKHHRAECVVILGVVYALDQNTVPIVGGPDAVNAALLTPRRVVPDRLLESRSKEGTAPGDRKIKDAKLRAFSGRSATARSVRTFPKVEVSDSSGAADASTVIFSATSPTSSRMSAETLSLTSTRTFRTLLLNPET